MPGETSSVLREAELVRRALLAKSKKLRASRGTVVCSRLQLVTEARLWARLRGRMQLPC